MHTVNETAMMAVKIATTAINLQLLFHYKCAHYCHIVVSCHQHENHGDTITVTLVPLSFIVTVKLPDCRFLVQYSWQLDSI